MGIELPYSARWKASRESWRLYQALLDGDKRILNSPQYLPQNDIEKNPQDGSQLYAIRQSVSFYRNQICKYVGRWSAKIFEPSLYYDPDYEAEYGAFLDSAIGGSEPVSFESFLATQFIASYLAQGGASILLDAPIRNGIVSVEEEELYRPYCKVISNLDLVYSEATPSGMYTVADIEYKKPRVGNLGHVEYDIIRKRYQLEGASVLITEYKKNQMSGDASGGEYEQEGDTILLNLGFIPLFTLKGISWVGELKEEALELHNKRSAINMLMCQQATLVRFLKTNQVGKGKLDISAWSWLKLGPNDEIGQLEPIYPQALKEEIAELRSEMDQKAAKMSRFIPTDSKVGQSAEAQEASEGPLEQACSILRESVEGFANIVLRHVPAFYGEQIAEGQLCRFTPLLSGEASSGESFAAIAALFPDEFQRSPTLKAEAIKALLSSDDIQMDEDKIKQVLAELGYAGND